MKPPPNIDGHGRDWVAIIIAIALGTAVNIIACAALYDAIANRGGLSENATQVLTTAFGGLVGVLGSYIGYRAGVKTAQAQAQQASPPPDDTTV